MPRNINSTPNWRRGALLVALPALASCDYFYETTVPGLDGTPPTAYAAVWRAEEYKAISSSAAGSPLVYTVEDPTYYYVLIGAGKDEGGTKKVTVHHEFARTCIKDDLGQSATGSMVPMVETQAGTVGATVSDGVWTGPHVRLSDYATCSAGWTLSLVTYSWHVTAEDFHGNVATHGWAKIRWAP